MTSVFLQTVVSVLEHFPRTHTLLWHSLLMVITNLALESHYYDTRLSRVFTGMEIPLEEKGTAFFFLGLC